MKRWPVQRLLWSQVRSRTSGPLSEQAVPAWSNQTTGDDQTHTEKDLSLEQLHYADNYQDGRYKP